MDFSRYLSPSAYHEGTMKAYKEAIKEGYKFGPYGDAMLMVD